MKFLFIIFFTVKVKWGRENFPDVSINTDEDPILFKAQLFALTGVQTNRQKVMCKGVALKDEEWNFPVKDVRIKKFSSLTILLRMSQLSVQH